MTAEQDEAEERRARAEATVPESLRLTFEQRVEESRCPPKSIKARLRSITTSSPILFAGWRRVI